LRRGVAAIYYAYICRPRPRQVRQGEELGPAQRFNKWRGQSASIRHKLNISAGWKGWTSTSRMLGLSRTERVADMLDCAWASRLMSCPPGTATDHARVDWWCDPSQSIVRTPWGDLPPVTTTNSIAFSFEQDLALSGYDLLRVQGIPLDAAPQMGSTSFTERQLHSLAGEAFFAPQMTSVAVAFYLNPYAPWWREA
jgi:hypothetical protein